MPGWNLDNRWDSTLVCDPKRLQTVTRPAVKQIVAPARQMPRRDPIKIFLFRAIIIRPVEKRDKTNWMPAQRIDQRRGNLFLPVVIGDCLSEKSAAIRGAQRLERVRVQSRTADTSEDGVEQMRRQHTWRLRSGCTSVFADGVEQLRPRVRCGVWMGLERVCGCDVYRARDRVHRSCWRRR